MSLVEQEFGAHPLKVRETDHYRQEYVRSFVEKWDQLINWDRRTRSEGAFFSKLLTDYGANKVLDVATGTGYHSVRLLQDGFEVVSADGSPEMLARAFSNARGHGLILRTIQADWRWLNRDIHGKFDAIICLGNSFTHLFSERARRKALAEFYAALRHDGILILDHRNYDTLLDRDPRADAYRGRNDFYYCADNVDVSAVHVDDGLARFRYEFPDTSIFHLNMFPLRREYTRRLMHEVGFQIIETYGDFQEAYREEPEFFVHVAQKRYSPDEDGPRRDRVFLSRAVATAREYYNSDDAEGFYSTIWGGEDIHIGLYEQDDESVFAASRRTVGEMARRYGDWHSDTRVLDIGSGYGGAARQLARSFGARVDGVNVSEVENQRARQLNQEQDLDSLVSIVDGNFENLPFSDYSYDVVWSQDALLHSGDRGRVVAEVHRVLRRGGHFIFTDPMQADACPPGVLRPILDRLHLDSLASPRFYRKTARYLGLEEVSFEDQTPQLITHYRRVLEETKANESTLGEKVDGAYIERMKVGLEHWIQGGEKGHLTWGIFHFRKS